MKDADIGTLARILPQVFDLDSFEGEFGDDWIAVEESVGSNDLNPIERAIVESETDTEALSGMSAGNRIIDIPEDGRWPGWDRERDIPLPPIIGREGGFPGRPDKGRGGFPPPPDAMAFYLPFHHFSRRVWGIYLIAEGVESLADDLVQITRGGLSSRDAVVAARAFLFHHEAYHSALEAFGTRLEVAHRERVYVGGLLTMFQRDGFEEALATAYAINRVKDKVLSGSARKMAVSALRCYVRSCAPPYSHGASLVGKKAFQPPENRFLEEALRLSVPSVRPVSETIWPTASYLTMPALRRQGRFTYLVHKGSSLARRTKLSIRYFDRRKLLQRLRDELGGREIGGGRHPKWESASGKKVPVPTGKDVDIGTLGSILKQFGIDQAPGVFMHGR